MKKIYYFTIILCALLVLGFTKFGIMMVEESDTSPTGPAYKIIYPNGSLSLSDSIATVSFTGQLVQKPDSTETYGDEWNWLNSVSEETLGMEFSYIVIDNTDGTEDTAILLYRIENGTEVVAGYWGLPISGTPTKTAATGSYTVFSDGYGCADGGPELCIYDGSNWVSASVKPHTEEIDIESTVFAPGASGPDATYVGNYPGLSYDINDDSKASIEIPYNWDEASDLTIYIYWCINEAYATNSGEIQWSIVWSACPVDGTESAASPTHTGSIDFGDQNIPATAYYMIKSTAGTISAASIAENDLLGMTISRVALDGGNNPTADPIITRIEIEFTSDKLGE